LRLAGRPTISQIIIGERPHPGRFAISVFGDDDYLLSLDKRDMLLANGIGGVRDLALRFAIQKRFETSGWKFVGVRHPSAVISSHARVAPCAQVMASAVIQPGAVIHAGCIVNTGAVVEHDTVLEPFVHVACNATICGSVKIGSYSHIGAGAVVRQNVSLGERTVVGAGAVVIYDHNDNGTLLGVPARPVQGRHQ
jgi:sugar O-acyltransferase (sialic acid O-acetyltransferase NeuD family)